MADRGFNIHGKHYPLVAFEDWLNQDFVLARQLTRVTIDDLFDDQMLLEQALVAVAYRHVHQELRHEQIVEVIGALKPSEIEDVGFETEEPPSPLSEGEPSANDVSFSPSSAEPSEAHPEPSPTGSSGGPGSEAGSQA